MCNRVLVSILSITTLAAPALAAPLFVDDFDNNDPLNVSGETPNYWSNESFGNAGPGEGASNLFLGTSGTPGLPFPAAVLGGPLTDDNDFFNPAGRIYSLRGLGYIDPDDQGPIAPRFDQGVFRFTLASSAGNDFSVDDALAVRVNSQNGVRLAYKLNNPNQSTEDPTQSVTLLDETIGDANAGNFVRGFDLTLQPAAGGGTSWSITFLLDQGSVVRSGVAAGLTQADWIPSGDSRLVLQGQLNNNENPNEGISAVLGSISVSAVPEPTAMAPLAVAGLIALRRKR